MWPRRCLLCPVPAVSQTRHQSPSLWGCNGKVRKSEQLGERNKKKCVRVCARVCAHMWWHATTAMRCHGYVFYSPDTVRHDWTAGMNNLVTEKREKKKTRQKSRSAFSQWIPTHNTLMETCEPWRLWINQYIHRGNTQREFKVSWRGRH